MGIEPTAGGCPATGFEVQERHQAANYSHCKLHYTFFSVAAEAELSLIQRIFHSRRERKISISSGSN